MLVTARRRAELCARAENADIMATMKHVSTAMRNTIVIGLCTRNAQILRRKGGERLSALPRRYRFSAAYRSLPTPVCVYGLSASRMIAMLYDVSSYGMKSPDYFTKRTQIVIIIIIHNTVMGSCKSLLNSAGAQSSSFGLCLVGLNDRPRFPQIYPARES